MRVGAVFWLSLCVLRQIRFHVIRRGAEPIVDPRILALACRCQREMGVRSPLRLRKLTEDGSPVISGLFRPVLWLPNAWCRAGSERELRGILLHELAHWKAGDLWINYAIVVCQALHWFNPMMWLVTRQVAAITAGLRVHTGSTPDPTRMRFVSAKKALMSTTQSRANRVSACQISEKPRASAYFTISIS